MKRSGEWWNMESKNLSNSLKLNESAALTTRSDETESVSRYTGYKPNNVWSGLNDVDGTFSLSRSTERYSAR